MDYFTLKRVMSEKAKEGNTLSDKEISKDLRASAKNPK